MSMQKVNAPRTDIRFTPLGGFDANVSLQRHGAVCQLSIGTLRKASTLPSPTNHTLVGTISPKPLIFTWSNWSDRAYYVNTDGTVEFGKKPGEMTAPGDGWRSLVYLCDPDAVA